LALSQNSWVEAPPLTVMRISAHQQTALGAVAAGLLLAASVPPWGWWPAAFVGIALLDQLIAGQPAVVRFRRTVLATAAWSLPATLWMLDLTLPGWVFAGLIHTAFFGLAAVVVPAGSGRRMGLVGSLTLAEFARWSMPFGGVPLATIPMGQANGPLAPIVRIAGPLLLVFIVVTVGMSLSALVDVQRGNRWAIREVVTGSGVVLLMLLLSSIAPTGHVVGDLDLAVVQGGGPQRTRASPTGASIVFANQMAASRLVNGPVDLVLWPENVVNPAPMPTSGNRRSDRLYPDEADMALTAEAQRLGAVLVPGWFHRSPSDPKANVNYSTAIESDGTVVDRYDKVRIVPFGEFVPLRRILDPIAGDILPSRDLLPGTGDAVLDTSAGRLGISISWEVFFEHRTRDATLDGAQILLNPTNGASYWLTQVQTQQVATSRLRALETGRWLIQAAPTGFSTIINPNGNLVARTNVGEQAVLRGTVELREGLTWATRLGPVPILILSTLLALAGHTIVLWRTHDQARIYRRSRDATG